MDDFERAVLIGFDQTSGLDASLKVRAVRVPKYAVTM